MNNKILTQNEKETNNIIAKTFPLFIFALIIFGIIESMGAFGNKYEDVSLILPFLIMSFILLLPLILYKLQIEKWWVKYVNLTIAIILSGVLYYLLTGDAVLLFPIPIVISILYFDKRLTLYAFAASTPIFSYLNYLCSENPFTDPWQTKVLTVSLFGGIGYVIVNKCVKLLNNLVSAEQQNELYSKVSSLLENSKNASNQINASVSNLLGVTEKARTFNQEISKNVLEVVVSSKESLDSSSIVSDEIVNVMNEIISVDDFLTIIKEISIKNNELIQSSNEKINLAVERIKTLSKVNEESFDTIKTLNKEFGNISTILDNINAISKQTKLLSLNASIEAARSGEYGLGFTVVAEEIGKLAEQTNDSTSNISQLIKNIQVSSRNADEVIEKGYGLINDIVADFMTIDERYKEIMHSEAKIKQRIDAISDKTKEISSKSNRTVADAKKINYSNKTMLESIENIARFTESQLDLNNEVFNLVKEVSDTAHILKQQTE